MPPAPPPPPPSTNLPNFSTKTSSSTIPSGVPNTSALLKSIEKGTRLKKTTTNDRSAPLTSNQPNSTAPNKSNQNSATSIRAGNLAAPSGLGGLFANGFPALKSTKAPSSKATVEIPTILQKPLNKAVTRARESIARDPERAINIANQGIKMAAPVIIPELTSQKSKINPSLKIPASLSDLGQKMNVISELPRKMERQSGDRWNFPIESDDFLPSPRKFTGSKKIYLSQNSGSNDDGKSSSDTQISKADMSGFIKSLKSKLNKAASEENFEECVRLKTKLKSFQSIENRIKSGPNKAGATLQMTRVTVPELKKFMDKRLCIQVNCSRKITGVLRGFDAFMNIVLDETIEETKTGNLQMGTVVLRGNSILMIESLERIN